MNTPLVTWICIAVFALLIITLRCIESFRRNSRSLRHHFIELAAESEGLFIPGDPSENDDICNDND